MSEKVLYRKWRPLTFNEVVGQEHVTKTLKNSIEAQPNKPCIFIYWAKGCRKDNYGKSISESG